MQLKALKTIFHQELETLYPTTEIDAFFYRLIEHYLGVERFVLVLHPHFAVSPAEAQPLFQALAQLKLEKPLQYILGVAHFMDLTVNVNEQVLIPRPETEELVQWVLEDVGGQRSESRGQRSEVGGQRSEVGGQRSEVGEQRSEVGGQKLEVGDWKPATEQIRLLDVGTGSGCIAIALAKKLPGATVYALDISEKALEVARDNAALHGVAISFLQGDMLSPELDLDLEFDLIVSNPPYVRMQEKAEMKNNVKQYEPSIALFVPDNHPLVYYEALAKLAQRHLRPGGALYLEINQYLAKETQTLLKAYNFLEIKGRTDIFGNERMLKGKNLP